jgi:hypothetical protein
MRRVSGHTARNTDDVLRTDGRVQKRRVVTPFKPERAAKGEERPAPMNRTKGASHLSCNSTARFRLRLESQRA